MRIGILFAALLAADLAVAGYTAPREFAGYRWRSDLSEFTGLELLGADIAELFNGRNVLAEYRAPAGLVELSGAPFRHVSFLFCGTPQRLGFCGVVLRFDDEHGSFEQIVADLIARHGEPRVDDAPFPIARYVWGGKGRHDVAPIHPVAITLTFEPRLGRGEIIYATQDLYRLAYRIHAYGDPNYYLHRRLEGGSWRQSRDRTACTGNAACRAERRPLNEEELAELQPDH